MNGEAPDELTLSALVEAALTEGTGVRFPVAGASMLPLVRPGDVVEVVPWISDAIPRIGRVVVASVSPGRILLHRVVGGGEAGVVLRGDNCALPDGVLPRDSILGVATKVERDGRAVWFGAGLGGLLVSYLVRLGLYRIVVRLYRVAWRVRGARADGPVDEAQQTAEPVAVPKVHRLGPGEGHDHRPGGRGPSPDVPSGEA
jgi:hypothetical protein